MQSMQLVADRAHAGAVQIVKKLLCEIEAPERPGAFNNKTWIVDIASVFSRILNRKANSDEPDAYLNDVWAYGQFMKTDFALELRGKKLWLFSIKVLRT